MGGDVHGLHREPGDRLTANDTSQQAKQKPAGTAWSDAVACKTHWVTEALLAQKVDNNQAVRKLSGQQPEYPDQLPN